MMALPRTWNIRVDRKNDVFVANPGGGVLQPRYADINQAAANVVSKYDANGDGLIDIGSEATRNVYTGAMSVTRDITRLARLADLNGNGDGKASAEEIEGLMRLYDNGAGASQLKQFGGWDVFNAQAGDGYLDGQELGNFLDDLGETETKNFPVWIDVPSREHPPISTIPTLGNGDQSTGVDPRLRP